MHPEALVGLPSEETPFGVLEFNKGTSKIVFSGGEDRRVLVRAKKKYRSRS